MNLLFSILSVIFIIYGLVLFFTGSKWSVTAGIFCLGAGVYSYDTDSFTPLFIGFALLWVLRAIGLKEC
jgi:hypothetical protein